MHSAKITGDMFGHVNISEYIGNTDRKVVVEKLGKMYGEKITSKYLWR